MGAIRISTSKWLGWLRDNDVKDLVHTFSGTCLWGWICLGTQSSSVFPLGIPQLPKRL